MKELNNPRQDGNRFTAELADMRKLQEISSSLIAENNVHQLYRDILDAAVTLSRSDMGSMQLFVPEANELLLLASKGFDPRSAAFWKRVKAHSGTVCGMALALGQRVVTSDIEQCDFIGEDDLDPFRWSGIRSVQTTPLVSRDGKVVGMISTHWKKVHRPSEHSLGLLDILARQAADLIERSKAEEALRESEERLQSAVLAAELGTFIWDLEKDEVRPDNQMLRLFEVPPTVPDLAAAFRSVFHPDDLARYLKAVEWASRSGTSGLIREDIRVVLPNGNERWLAFHAQVYAAPKTGKAEHMAGCVIDITGRKTLEQHKNDFIAMASHELMTPVTGIKAYVQLLLNRFHENSDETNFQAIRKLGKQTDRLIILLDRLVDTTRIMEDLLELNPEKTDLNGLIGEYIHDLQLFSRKHRLIFEAGAVQPVFIDRDRIGQALTNLILNAMKYSPDGGDISITSEATDGGQIRVSVMDSGIGVAEELKGRIFERFFRISEGDMRSSAGMGLGLYICDAIIRQHGGEIGVENKVGKGAVFYFTLPYPETAVIPWSKPSDDDLGASPEQQWA
ncbi:ATP-binding protein [Parapedobacter sp. DT-150]|uniref:ATP-binding protein n=1 Tax=Parapedobacter sp. DT-150 TaxID=3396162 RepID=UPI003F1B880C